MARFSPVGWEKAISPLLRTINAAVLTGLPGVLLVVLLLFGLLKLVRTVIRLTSAHDSSVRWIGIGAFYGLLAYVINAQFHNSGFVSGDAMPWWLIGLMIAIVTNLREQDRLEAAMPWWLIGLMIAIVTNLREQDRLEAQNSNE